MGTGTKESSEVAMCRTLLVVLIAGCIQVNAQVESTAYNLLLSTLLSHSVPEVSVAALAMKKDAVLLDAREPAEYGVSKIAKAIYVGYENPSLTELRTIKKDQEIVVYCSIGFRSEKIAEQLRQAGFTHVSTLYGGIFEWINQGHEVVDSLNRPTDRVHAYSPAWGVWLTRGVKVYEAP